MADTIQDFFADAPEDVKEIIEQIIGIDLGTCNSCCGIWRNGSLEIIADEYGNRTIPSVISFTSKQIYVGTEAKNKMLLDSTNSFYEIKRLIGKKIDDCTVIGDKKFLSYKLCGDEKGNVRILRQKGKTEELITPEELSSYILMKLKHMASEYLQQDVKKAVIAVPAYFNDAQRQATRDAATIAGLECVRIISEPIASALAYGLSKLTKIAKSGDVNVVVYDLGGGTLDVSLLSINDGVFEVVGCAGNTHLGGVDFDNRIYEYCLNYFKSININFSQEVLTRDAIQKLRKACENAKKILSTSIQTTIAVTNFYDNQNLILNMTRQKFNEICNDLFILCLKPLDDILNNCSIKKDGITEIILVGGMTRIPIIRENIQRFFGKCPNSSINPDEIVAAGAAIQGYILAHKNDPFSDSVTLLDTTPLSLGIETIGGVMNVMIQRGALIPTSEKKIFTNDTANETSVNIKVYEGERKMTKDNFLVGEFELSGLSQEPRGYHKIDVIFTIDVDGMITVTAEDLRKNSSNTLRINGNRGRLSTQEIEKIIATAKEYEVNDKIMKKKKKLHYELFEVCDNIIKNLDTNKTQISDEDKLVIKEDVLTILETLKKPFDEIEEEYYSMEVKRLNKNYCVLVSLFDEDATKKPDLSQVNQTGTSIFQNEEDEEKTYQKVASMELGFTETIDTTKLNEIKQIRDTILTNCHTIIEILESPGIPLDENDKTELKDYIEDTVVWIHIQPKITYGEYVNKMDEINEKCNEYIKVEENNSIGTIDELKTLCDSLKSSLGSNLLAIDELHSGQLEHAIDNVVNWMKTNKLSTSEEYQEKIDYLNSYCNEIYADIYNEKNENAESLLT